MNHTKKPPLQAGALLALALLAMCTVSVYSGNAAAAESGIVSDSKITILYDAFGRDDSLQKDWGFAALVEAGGKRILFDTGNNSELLAHNVRAKAIDLTRLDFVVMSHRHGDHMGGLDYLLKVNPGVKIYVPKENFGVFGATLPGTFYRRNQSLPEEMRYFDGRPPATLHFGTPWPQGKFTYITETTEVAPGVHLILLKGTWGVDLDVMEISLAIDTPEGTVLIVGCGHPTIEKIVETATTLIGKPVHLLIGGLHLLPADNKETQRIADTLHDTWKVQWMAPGHCTGEPAFAILRRTFGDHYLYAGLGTTLILGNNRVSVD
jgi:7,8-dihydropterin-6-yl-methyl-4-(beta-D-ribofuranosyl)aminobenzene 5'-phosphate synthase